MRTGYLAVDHALKGVANDVRPRLAVVMRDRIYSDQNLWIDLNPEVNVGAHGLRLSVLAWIKIGAQFVTRHAGLAFDREHALGGNVVLVPPALDSLIGNREGLGERRYPTRFVDCL